MEAWRLAIDTRRGKRVSTTCVSGWDQSDPLPHPLTQVVLTSTHSSPLPAYAVLRVFQNDTAPGKLIANFVGAVEVAAVTRFLALVNQLLNFVVEHLALRLTEYV